MIKSAAGAASPAAWARLDDGGSQRDDGDGRTTDRIGQRRRGAPEVIEEAALAADLITARKFSFLIRVTGLKGAKTNLFLKIWPRYTVKRVRLRHGEEGKSLSRLLRWPNP